MNQPEIKKLFADNYVMLKLDVQENGEKKQTLENPGGVQIMADLGGAQSGLPFYAIVDTKGKKLGDANCVPPKNANIGYPGEPQEINAFAKLIKDTAPNMKPDQLTRLVDYLRKNAPKH